MKVMGKYKQISPDKFDTQLSYSTDMTLRDGQYKQKYLVGQLKVNSNKFNEAFW